MYFLPLPLPTAKTIAYSPYSAMMRIQPQFTVTTRLINLAAPTSNPCSNIQFSLAALLHRTYQITQCSSTQPARKNGAASSLAL